MVLGVCRRVLHDLHDAEDACQAAFLILACKAASVRRAGALGGWLHAVAFRVACRLRAGRARRRDAERPLSDAPAPSEPTWREAQVMLDEELQRLPKKWRAPLVLCYLEGKTRDEAAKDLGWSVGTVRGRLARGRARLRTRLGRRGVSLSVPLAAGPAQAESALCVATTVRAVLGPAPVGSRPEVAQLVEEVMRTMSLSRKKVVVSLVLAVLVGVGLSVLAFHGLAGEQSPSPSPSASPAQAGRQEGRPTQKPADVAAKLIGTWLPLSSGDVGEGFQQYKVEITKDRITFQDRNEMRVFRYGVDMTEQPAALDLTSTDGGANVPAIYVVDGDYLQICFDFWDGTRPPDVFTTVRERGGQTLLLLKREGSRTATAATARVRASLVAIGMAMHYYEADRRSLPPAARYDQQGNALWSWRAALLPYLQQDNLFQLVRLDEPWDSQGNKTVAGVILRVYEPVEAKGTETRYRVLVGPGAAFDTQKERRLEDLTAGGRNPILVVEAADTVPWMKPAELPYAPDRPLPRLGGVVEGGCHALFADG
jgi:RNA polymerase sigma factor (sigma-70 family)